MGCYWVQCDSRGPGLGFLWCCTSQQWCRPQHWCLQTGCSSCGSWKGERKKKSEVGHITSPIKKRSCNIADKQKIINQISHAKEVKCACVVYLELEALFLASFCRLYEEEPGPPASEESTFSFFTVEGSRWSILPWNHKRTVLHYPFFMKENFLICYCSWKK